MPDRRSREPEHPMVSVLMPAYNREAFIRASIASVIGQTFQDFELIIVDDGSADRTREIVRSINDSRLRLVENSVNLGIAKSRNKAIDIARGTYLAWLDSDDIATVDRLEKQVLFLEQHPDFCLCCGNADIIDERGNRIEGPLYRKGSPPLNWLLLWGNPIAQSSVMIRRSFLVSESLLYNESLPLSEDYDLWCRIAKIGKTHRLEDTILHYRRTEGSAFHSAMGKAFAVAAKTNEAYARSICGNYDVRHEALTVFGSGMKDRFDGMGAASIAQLFRESRRAFLGLFPADREVIHAIDLDIIEMLRAFVEIRPILAKGWRNAAALLSIAPDAYFSALAARAVAWLKKRLRPFALSSHDFFAKRRTR